MKAIRLQSGKVLAADMVIFMETKESFKIFEDSGIDVSDRICVNEKLQTNVAHVYAVDHISSINHSSPQKYFSSLTALEEQGKALASFLNGQDYHFNHSAVETAVTKLGDWTFMVSGKVNSLHNSQVFYRLDRSKNNFYKFFMMDDSLIGAVAIGQELSQDMLLEMVKIRAKKNEVCERLGMDLSTYQGQVDLSHVSSEGVEVPQQSNLKQGSDS